jgi:DNA transformation protein and related proteins
VSEAPRLRDLPNLGPASEAMLVAAGISTPDDLDRLGAVEAYRRAVQSGAPRHTMLLWSLDAALLGVDWRDVPLERRREVSDEAERAFADPGRAEGG